MGIQTLELCAIDGFTTRAVMVGEVSTLEHEFGNDTVEAGALIAKAVLACSKLTEVLGSFGYYVVIELELDAARRAAADRDIELGLISSGSVSRGEHSRRRLPWWIARDRDGSQLLLDKVILRTMPNQHRRSAGFPC